MIFILTSADSYFSTVARMVKTEHDALAAHVHKMDVNAGTRDVGVGIILWSV